MGKHWRFRRIDILPLFLILVWGSWKSVAAFDRGQAAEKAASNYSLGSEMRFDENGNPEHLHMPDPDSLKALETQRAKDFQNSGCSECHETPPQFPGLTGMHQDRKAMVERLKLLDARRNNKRGESPPPPEPEQADQ